MAWKYLFNIKCSVNQNIINEVFDKGGMETSESIHIVDSEVSRKEWMYI